MKKILRFTASWCGPCKMLAKTLEDVDLGMPVEVVDIDENGALAQQYGVRGVPTLVMVEDDKEVKRQVGLVSASQLKEWGND